MMRAVGASQPGTGTPTREPGSLGVGAIVPVRETTTVGVGAADTPGWIRTSDSCPRKAELCPLSYGREEEPPAGIEPALRPYEGRVLAVDTTEACVRVETVGLEPTSTSLQARCSSG
jgi:hypothetical protein